MHIPTCKKDWKVKQLRKPPQDRKPLPEKPYGYEKHILKETKALEVLEEIDNEEVRSQVSQELEMEEQTYGSGGYDTLARGSPDNWKRDFQNNQRPNSRKSGRFNIMLRSVE